MTSRATPAGTRRTSSCNWVRGLASLFGSQGLDVPALFTAAGIAPCRLENPVERFHVDEVSVLWELAVQQAGNPALGLDRALTLQHVNFDLLGFAMLASPDLRAALHAFARYLALVSDAATFELEPAPDGNAWLALGHQGNTRPVPRQRFAYGLLSMLTLSEWLTRRDMQPLAATFKFPRPAEAATYEAAFRCPLHFDSDENRLLLAAQDLDAPLPSRDEGLLAVHESLMRDRLQALGNARASYRVAEEILRRLQRGEPRREEVAASLAMADRTLQRRLHAEGTSFQQLLDETRRELARKYLADARYAPGQVAHLLGFADQSNFVRACKRWFGLPPGQYRERLAAEAAP